ncbi:hypothetical protein ACFFRC_09130 [Amycolatopsis halotolerans]|uniref:hypothetical protein n=1 Tax=Amycolatopsis halotolerans TaxID=330083 RepID=UPI0035EECD9D
MALPSGSEPDLIHLRNVGQMTNMSDQQIWRDAMSECVRLDRSWTLIAAALGLSKEELRKRFRPVPGRYVDPISHNEWHVRSAEQIVIAMPNTGGQTPYDGSADQFVWMAARDKLVIQLD